MGTRSNYKRVVLYARCSTSDQSVDLQLDALREYASARGFEVVEERPR